MTQGILPPPALPLSLVDAAARYGPVIGGKWAREGEFCRILKIPQRVSRVWKNRLTGKPTERIYCNRDLHDPLTWALEMLVERDLLDELKTFDGCYNIRDVRGIDGKPSAHSYAIAIDLNAASNPLGSHGTLSPEFVECFTDQGFVWGGDFPRRDPMHFSLGW